MVKLKRSPAVLAAIAVLLFAFAFVGCTKHPNEDQLNALEETKKAAFAAEDQCAAKKQENERLEKQLAEKKQALEEMKQEKAKVESRLSGE